MKNTERDSNHILEALIVRGIFALSGIVGPLVLIVLDLVASVSEPKYNSIRDSISSLALTSMGSIQTTGFLIIGVLVEIFAAGLFLNIQRRRGFGLGIGLLAGFGFGLLLVGAFRTDPIGRVRTIDGTIHDAAAFGVFGLFPIALSLLLSSLRSDPHWQGMFRYTVITIVIALVLTLGRLFVPSHLSWFGLYERLLVANALVWVEVAAVWLLLLSLRQHRKDEQADRISA